MEALAPTHTAVVPESSPESLSRGWPCASHLRPENIMPDVLLTCTLFREDGSQLAGPAMVKTQPMHTVGRVAGAVCRWAVVPLESCRLISNGQPLEMGTTVAGAGLGSGHAINIMLAAAAPEPSAEAKSAPFAMIDVRCAYPCLLL